MYYLKILLGKIRLCLIKLLKPEISIIIDAPIICAIKFEGDYVVGVSLTMSGSFGCSENNRCKYFNTKNCNSIDKNMWHGIIGNLTIEDFGRIDFTRDKKKEDIPIAKNTTFK